MPKYRHQLPQFSNRLFLTDGGLETTLIFHDGAELPYFAAFDLLKTRDGAALIRRYYERYAALARQSKCGFVPESATWRANRDWGERLGYSAQALAAANRRSIELMEDIRDVFETRSSPMVLSGAIGPRGDGYKPDAIMSAEEAEDYHAEQIDVFRSTEADMVCAFTLNYAEEAVGIARAAKVAQMPAAISFTVETDGKLPTGQSLKDAIETVDAESGGAPVYYMINCAHPTHFEGALASGEAWVKRVRGIRANASTRSHAELDDATDLDAGDPVDLGRRYRVLRNRFGHFNVLGGCCGTDHRHVEQISFACTPVSA